MTTDREVMLTRIRTALSGVPAGEPAAWSLADDLDPAASYLEETEIEDPLATLMAKIRGLDAKATICSGEGTTIADTVSSICREHRARRVVIPAGLTPSWIPSTLEALDGECLSAVELDAVDGVLTGCAVAIAQTGTIVLDAGVGQGSRRLTLLPDLHICVITADRIVGGVVTGLRRMADAVRAGRPVTLVSGPSATSDIELQRVEGVHGPRRLEVIVVEGSAGQVVGSR